MEDFFKQFRDNLERRPRPPFEERDWQDLEKRLERQGEKRPAALAWVWLAWPLLFLSLGANALFFFQLKNGSSTMAAHKTSKDTVFLTQTIFKTDTIYQTRFVSASQRYTSNIQPPLSESSPFPQRLMFSSSATDVHDKIETSLYATHLAKTPSAADNQNQLLKNSPTTASEILPYSILNPLPSSVHRAPSTAHRSTVSGIPVEPITSKQKKTLQYHLYRMRPKGFRLGLTGGWAYPFSKGLEQQGGFSAGAEAAVEFLPNLRLWASTAYFSVRFVSDRMGDDIGIPVVFPPSDDFDFVEAEAPQPSWEHGIGLQYLFNTSRKFKPFLGAGWGAVSLLPYEVVYDFENQPLGIEWSLEKTVNRREFLTNLLLLRAGFESKFSKKWQWQLRASYRAHFERTGFQTPDMFSVQAGLMRRF